MDTVKALSRYIPEFEKGDLDNLGAFEKAVYKVEEEHPEYDLKNYNKILEKNGLEWSADSLINADVSDKDVQCLLAMILSIIRADRFDEGVLIDFIKEGYITKWLIELEKRAV